MARVQRSFVVVEYVELLIIIVTAVVAVAQKTRPALAGVALGLLISASLLWPSIWLRSVEARTNWRQSAAVGTLRLTKLCALF